jgi:hypothetical protein
LHGQRIGYTRVSSLDQNPERQLEQIPLDRVFTDQASGRDIRRPELERLLAFVREGDTVVVHSMDRLARNLDDLRRSFTVSEPTVRRCHGHLRGVRVPDLSFIHSSCGKPCERGVSFPSFRSISAVAQNFAKSMRV